MSGILYDDALLKKLQGWVKDPNIKITGPGETHRLFEYRSDMSKDTPIKLPLITLARDPVVTILNPGKKPITYSGWRRNHVVGDDGNLRASQLNAIAISLSYQIDIYTRYRDEADEYLRNFIFNITNSPKVVVEIPYHNSNILHDSYIRLSPDVHDNSNIPERLVPGEFTRYTISIYIDDAYMWNYKVKPAVKVICDDVEVSLINEQPQLDETNDRE